MDLAVSAVHRGVIKESKKLDKYLDLAREQDKSWYMQMTMISIFVGVCELSSPKEPEKKNSWVSGGEEHPTQTLLLLRSTRIEFPIVE